MGLNIGSTALKYARIGDTKVRKIAVGNVLAYEVFYDTGTYHVSWSSGYATGTDRSALFSSLVDGLRVEAGMNGTNTTVNESTVRTTNSINFDRIRTLYIDWSGEFRTTTSNSLNFLIGTTSTGTFTSFTRRLQKTATFTRRIDSLDTSSVTGSRWIRVHARDGSTSNATGCSARIFGIYAEYASPPAVPSDWVYIGTTGTHNTSLNYNYTGGGCPTLSQIDFHLTANQPPADYSVGHVMRVVSFDAIDGIGCGSTFWQAAL